MVVFENKYDKPVCLELSTLNTLPSMMFTYLFFIYNIYISFTLLFESEHPQTPYRCQHINASNMIIIIIFKQKQFLDG